MVNFCAQSSGGFSRSFSDDISQRRANLISKSGRPAQGRLGATIVTLIGCVPLPPEVEAG